MPPRRLSRYTFTEAFTDADGDRVLTDPDPFRFKDFPDNRIHVVTEGDTLWSLAGRYFGGSRGFEVPEDLWWVIADFQPDPIHDPTLKLTPGRAMVIPSVRTVLEEVFSETRRKLEASGEG